MDAVRRFLAELRRRKVYRVGVVYAAVAFVVWQVADIAFPSLGLPESALGAVLVFTVLGFPVALVLAWAYEVRPEAAAGVPTNRETTPDTAARAASSEAEASAAVSTQSNSVAILPFESMSPGEEGEYLADGIAEEITNVLAGLADLHVAARTSAFRSRGSKLTFAKLPSS